MKKRKLLLLGGTTEAVKLQSLIEKISVIEMITSLAGRTNKPVSKSTRIGGFGGVCGLIDYLQQQKIDLIIDATHPFANQMSWNGYHASVAVKIPHLQLVRSPWEKHPEDQWLEVDSHKSASEILPQLGQRIFLTIGRQELAQYSHLKQLWFLMRMIDPPSPPLPTGEIILARGPFSLDQEKALLKQYQIEVIVSKNSGGEATYQKIMAARELNIPVVMIKRPLLPPCDRVFNVENALKWLEKLIFNPY